MPNNKTASNTNKNYSNMDGKNSRKNNVARILIWKWKKCLQNGPLL